MQFAEYLQPSLLPPHRSMDRGEDGVAETGFWANPPPLAAVKICKIAHSQPVIFFFIPIVPTLLCKFSRSQMYKCIQARVGTNLAPYPEGKNRWRSLQKKFCTPIKGVGGVRGDALTGLYFRTALYNRHCCRVRGGCCVRKLSFQNPV